MTFFPSRLLFIFILIYFLNNIENGTVVSLSNKLVLVITLFTLFWIIFLPDPNSSCIKYSINLPKQLEILKNRNKTDLIMKCDDLKLIHLLVAIDTIRFCEKNIKRFYQIHFYFFFLF